MKNIKLALLAMGLMVSSVGMAINRNNFISQEKKAMYIENAVTAIRVAAFLGGAAHGIDIARKISIKSPLIRSGIIFGGGIIGGAVSGISVLTLSEIIIHELK